MPEPRSLSEQMFSALHDRHPQAGEAETEVALSRVRVKQAGDAAGLAITRAERISQDGTKNAKAQAVAAAKAVESALAPKLEGLATNEHSLQAEMDRINARLADLSAPPESRRHVTGAILQHVINLKTGDKLKLLREAQDSGDILTQQAMLEMPAYVTGLPQDIISHGRRHLHMQLAPNDVLHRDRLQGSLEISRIVARELGKLVKQYKTSEVEALIEAAKEAA